MSILCAAVESVLTIFFKGVCLNCACVLALFQKNRLTVLTLAPNAPLLVISWFLHSQDEPETPFHGFPMEKGASFDGWKYFGNVSMAGAKLLFSPHQIPQFLKHSPWLRVL